MATAPSAATSRPTTEGSRFGRLLAAGGAAGTTACAPGRFQARTAGAGQTATPSYAADPATNATRTEAGGLSPTTAIGFSLPERTARPVSEATLTKSETSPAYRARTEAITGRTAVKAHSPPAAEAPAKAVAKTLSTLRAKSLPTLPSLIFTPADFPHAPRRLFITTPLVRPKYAGGASPPSPETPTLVCRVS